MAQPMASSVDIGWHDGKPRVVSQDVREYMQGSARAHRPQAAAAHAPAGRLPRPRSKNAPTPAKTVDYSRVPRNEVDAFTLRTPQDGRPTHGRGAAELVLDNAESLRQLEYLAHTSSAAGASARATAADLRQSATRGGDERGGVGRGGVAGCKGAVAARGASSLRHSSSTALPPATREKRSKGGAAMACSLMLLALAVQPAVSQMESGPVTPDSVFEAHDTLTRRAADEAVAECARGSHRTSGGVTSAGSAGCRYPRRAHAVEEGDELGKLLAPLYPWEFLLASEGGTWGRSPRHISRQDHRYFDAFRLYGDEQIHELLKNCRAVSDSRSNSTQMRHLEDVKLVKGRRDARTVAGPQPAPEGADAPLPADVSWMEVLGYYEEGYSVVVGHVDVRSRRIAAFVAGLEEQTGIPMRAHLQWTPPFTDAGGEHTGQLHEPPLDAWGAARGKQTGGAAAASGYERARLLEAPAREGVGDVFLLQLSGRQIIHAYEGRGVPAVQGAAAAGGGDASGLAQEQGQQGGAAVHDGPQEGAQGGGGVVEERGEKVEGMVVGEEVDERDMFTTLLRPGDTLYIPRGWTYESTTNTSFLESPSAHVALMAHVGAVSWQTVVHAAIKVVVEEEEASHPHFLGQRIPLLEQAAASLSHLFGGGQEAGEGRDRDDDERGRGGPAARAHLLDSVPAEIAAVWPCAGATLSLQDVLHWLVSALALSEDASTSGEQALYMAATEGTCLKCTVPLPPESAHGAQLFLASSASFLRSQTDHVLLDRVLDQLAISQGNFSAVAHALKVHGGRASFGHAKASPRWLQVERECPEGWRAIVERMEQHQAGDGLSPSAYTELQAGLRDVMRAMVSAAREMKTLVFAQVGQWQQQELASQRAARQHHLARHASPPS